MRSLRTKNPNVEPLTEIDIRRIVREELGRGLLNAARPLLGETDHYSTRGGDRHAPPEYQGRAKKWRTDAPTIPGAAQVGRWWTVSRAAYQGWIASKATVPVAPTNDVKPWSPEDALEGLRAVNGGRG